MRAGRTTVLAIAVLLSATAAFTAGCADAHNALGTSSSVCFQAIPVGRNALGTQSASEPQQGQTTTAGQKTAGQKTQNIPAPSFIGVRSATQKDIDTFGQTHNYLRADLEKRNGGPIKSLCLVGFHGSFEPALVHDLIGPVPPVGHRIYAVVVVSEPSNKLLATILRAKVPISFEHYAVGGG